LQTAARVTPFRAGGFAPVVERTDRSVLVWSLVAIVLALGMVGVYLGPRLLDIPPLEVVKVLGAILAGLLLGIPLSWVKEGPPWPGRRMRELGHALGLEPKGHSLHGTWRGRHVILRTGRDGGPLVFVGVQGKEGQLLWDATERRLEELLTPRKEPAPMPTGDRAFDDRFIWRPAPGQTTLSGPVRKALLSRRAGMPDQVEALSTGLSYMFDGDDESVPRLRAAMDGAVDLAEAMGLPPEVALQGTTATRGRKRR
jgi:hypothetical protein